MGNPNIGLRPLPDAKGQVNTAIVTISSSNTEALGIGSAYYMTAGQARAVVDYVDGAEAISGSIVRLMTTDNKTVQNVPASTAGYMAEVTIDANQRFAIRIDGTGIAAADVGKLYSLTNETMTAHANGFDGDAFSKRELDSTKESTSVGALVLNGLTGAYGNAYATDGAEAIVTLNPDNYVQA